MPNRPIYIRKYHSGRLKEFGYHIRNTFDESKDLLEIISLSDNQILRTLREVRNRAIHRDKLELLIKMRDFYKFQLTYQQSSKGSAATSVIAEKLACVKTITPLTKRLYKKYINISANMDEAKRLQDKINRTLFNPDYITVVMDTPKQYEYLYQNGFYVNGDKYKRLSCSAGQARVSTVVFANEQVLEETKRRLHNGRNMQKKFSPSKFNAYFGLYGSATKTVSEPKFIVVKDFENTTSFLANYVIENGWNVDDTIIQKEIKDLPMNRTDGMGLISYRQACIWAEELELDYVPSEFCIRQSFLKGMLCVFPIHEFCKEVNQNNFIVDTIYKDDQGNYTKADLRDYDVIISQSQFKLWDSYDSIDSYLANCHAHHLIWGISLVSPKEPKRMLKLNYQFIQTLQLSQKDVEALAAPFVDWISGVSYENVYYMLLFLLGVNNDAEKTANFLSGSELYWMKSLLVNHCVKNDKYIRSKIRELLKHKIENGCKGDIYVDGNFQVIVSDPYGFMQHVCGLPVTGLLKPGMSYSNYWNDRKISRVDAMRSPLTYLSEHVILNLQKDEETEKWYRYIKQGIILNDHGHETVNFAGSDFDMDILATTSNPIMMKGVYRNELPVVYDAPKPKKILFTEDDLYQSDTFSFGSIIGSITNKSSMGYAKLPLIELDFGKESPEYQLMKSRLMQCCKAQSAQIDKAKIGQEVKGIPKVWVNRKKIKKNKRGEIVDRHAEQKKLYNHTILDQYPYFFRYVYQDTNRKFKKYLDENNVICKQKFRMPVSDLQNLPDKTEEQKRFLKNFCEFSPVLISDSPMNLLCRYLERKNFHISQKTKLDAKSFDYRIYKRNNLDERPFYDKVKRETQQFMLEQRSSIVTVSAIGAHLETSDSEKAFQMSAKMKHLRERLRKINQNPYLILNCLIEYFYVEKPNSSKDILWNAYGKYMYQNVIKNSNAKSVFFPFPCQDEDTCDLQYLGYRYKLTEVKLTNGL